VGREKEMELVCFLKISYVLSVPLKISTCDFFLGGGGGGGLMFHFRCFIHINFLILLELRPFVCQGTNYQFASVLHFVVQEYVANRAG